MSAVIRLKRKACAEPVEGLVIALKRSRCQEIQDDDKNEVLFKFAATLKSQTESVKDHLQAALSKDRSQKFSKWRDPKGAIVNQKNVQVICDKLRKENRAASEKKKLDLLNNRRLILSETVPIEEEADEANPNTEVRKLFQLYDIIEENEETKRQLSESVITCNGEPLIREKASDYVYDVYIADVQIDDSFVCNPVSLRPYTVTDEDIYSGDSDNASECFDDEDDSNDENNWRNDYPEDEESGSEKDSIDESGDDEYDHDPSYWRAKEAKDALDHFHLEDDGSEEESFDQSRILNDLNDEYSDDDASD